MVVYAIDFRSEHTVTYTINTVSVAINIAKYFGLSEEELEHIYLGALLHDVGKIAIPTSILEFPGKLSDEQMRIMRTHVTETEKIIKNCIPTYICNLAVRHHEKLDGSGYPYGLTGKDLSFSERIVAIADIVSALSSRRSYKEPFPKDKTLAILSQMSERQLYPHICNYVCNNYDLIIENTEQDRRDIIEKYQQMFAEYSILKNHK